MHIKTTCILLLSGVLSVSCGILSQAIKSKLPKDVATSFEVIDSLSYRDLSFPSVAEAREFVKACNQLRYALADVDDEQWEGAAKEVRRVIEEPNVVQVCNVPETTLNSMEILDDEGNSENLSPKSVWRIKSFRGLFDEEKILGVMFSKLVDQKLSRMSLKILQLAAQDTPLIFGEKKFGWTGEKTITGCDLKEVSKICDIIRGSSPVTQVTGDDFAKLSSDIKNKDAGFFKNPDHDKVKQLCKSVRPNLMLFSYIDEYQKAGLVHTSDIERMSQADQEFNFYYQLKNLCDAALQ